MMEKMKNTVRVFVLISAVVMIAVGITGGDFSDVFSKAVMICLECIGIG